jgi:hypothetical protein
MEQLLIDPNEIVEGTIIGGNIDIDKYVHIIRDVQILVVEPLIGVDLYFQLKTQVATNTVSIENSVLLNDFLKPIIKYQACAEYIEIGSYFVTNAGIYKNQPKDSLVVDKKEVQYIADIQRSKAQTYIDRYIKKYSICSSSLNKVSNGWYI